MSTNKSTWKKLTSMRLFMPLVCLLAIIIVATITIPGFLSMSLKNGVPYGYPVDVINRASELVILSVGMTLVTAASGGQDISVGAVMAVCQHRLSLHSLQHWLLQESVVHLTDFWLQS